MLLALLTIQSLDQVEDYVIAAAMSDGGQALDEEQAHRLLRLSRGMSQRHLTAY